SYASSDTIDITGSTTGEEKAKVEDQNQIEPKQQPTQSIAEVSESKVDNVPEAKNEPLISGGEEHSSSATSGVVMKLTDVSGANVPSSSMNAPRESIAPISSAESSSDTKDI
ncbi:hypothetical protein BLA29_006682, partial [Euroglyphus maynei]